MSLVMNSKTRLDYALFQLTPTRTRCDLVIFGGNASEKLASGLLEPFLSHLNSAKHQVSKGGYSITLQPSQISPWFTKATLERFVKFVSTPELLERFATLEQELTQIRIQNDGGSYRPDNALQDENLKDNLQHVLESRKSVLQKEEAMAYARALVAGFEVEHIDDLIFFADAFGASRLRIACLNFKELCNKKNGDSFWRDDAATMQASSHSGMSYMGTSEKLLVNKNNESSPEFMINVQNGRLSARKPTESVDVSRSESTTSWPLNIEDVSLGLDEDQDRDQNYKYSSRTRVRSLHGKASQAAEQEGNYVTSDSSSGSGSDEYGKTYSSTNKNFTKIHGKESSRKVVIYNVNYSTSTEDGEEGTSMISSNKDEFIIVNSIEEKAEEAAGSLERRISSGRYLDKTEGNKNDKNVYVSNNVSAQNIGNVVIKDSGGEKSNENWDIFQNLIMKEAASGSNVMDHQSIQKKYLTGHTRDKPIESVNVKLASHFKQATRTARGTHERNYTNKETNPKVSASSLRISKSETITRSNKPAGSRTTIHQSKLEQEEEKRRRMEEIVTQRQKRIAERSWSKGITSKSTKGNLQERKKTGIEPMKKAKVKVQVSPSDINKLHKPIFRSSPMDRMAASRITHKLSSGEHRRESTKGSDGEIFSSDRTSKVGNKKFSNGTNISEKNKGQNASNSLPYSASKTPEKKGSMTTLPKHYSTSHGTQPSKSVRKSDSSAELCTELSVKKRISTTPPGYSFDENGGLSRNRNFNWPIDRQSKKSDHMIGDNKVTSKALHVHEKKRASSNFGQVVLGRTINLHEQRSIPGAPDFLATGTSTPAPEIHLREDSLPSRKKWDHAEDSLKATKGFRKILLFGLTS